MRLTDLQNDQRSLRTGQVSERGIITSAYVTVTPPDELNPRFAHYLLHGYDLAKVFYRMGGGLRQSMKYSDLKRLPLVIPPGAMQKCIANFLDEQTARIDALIAEKERLLEKLLELYRSKIWALVTKGQHAAGELSDSPCEWIGEMPKHWAVRKIKWISPVLRGASPRPIDDPKYFETDGEYSWVRIADVSAADGILLETEQKLSSLGASLSVKREPGDLFLSIAGTVGKPCIAGIKCCIHDGFVWFPSVGQGYLRDWLFNIFEAGFAYAGLGKMGTQLNLNTDTVGNIAIPLPPASEMKTLLSVIEETKEANSALQRHVSEHIDRLREYRSSLISASVTGQLNLDHFMLEPA